MTRPKFSAAQPVTTTSDRFWSIASLINQNAFLYAKMSDVSDKSTRTASRSAEPTSGADSAAIIGKRKDPPSPRQTARNHKRTKIADNGPPIAPASSSSYAIPAPASRTKCFRISEIPQDWEKDDLLDALQAIDAGFRDQKPQL